jgi:hypothetical protein
VGVLQCLVLLMTLRPTLLRVIASVAAAILADLCLGLHAVDLLGKLTWAHGAVATTPTGASEAEVTCSTRQLES